jgi:hypothetical protein
MRHSFSSIEKESLAQDKAGASQESQEEKSPHVRAVFLHRGAVPSADVSVDGTWRDARQNEKARHLAWLSVDGAKSLWLNALCLVGVTKE